jgi:hypothetical protein
MGSVTVFLLGELHTGVCWEFQMNIKTKQYKYFQRILKFEEVKTTTSVTKEVLQREFCFKDQQILSRQALIRLLENFDCNHRKMSLRIALQI